MEEKVNVLFETRDYQIAPLSQENAEIIANEWKYSDEYAFYDLTADPEDYEEMMDAKQRGDSYYQVMKAGELFGYFVLETIKNTNEMMFGLGMKPEFTGNGLGKEFFELILAFIQANFAVNRVLLAVAEFNLRAQKLYQNLGFKQTGRYIQKTNGGEYPFISMALTL